MQMPSYRKFDDAVSIVKKKKMQYYKKGLKCQFIIIGLKIEMNIMITIK